RSVLEASPHPEGERQLHCLDGFVSAVGIAGEIGLAHASDEMLCSAPIAQRARKREENEIAAGHERRRQPALADLDGDRARERGVGDSGERAEVKQGILAPPLRPRRVEGSHALTHARACLELGAMALVVIEAHGLDADETLERPRQAYRRILSSREQDERAVWID